jgi:hypothetical protein
LPEGALSARTGGATVERQTASLIWGFVMTKRVLVQAGHMAPRQPGHETATGAPGEALLVADIRDALVALLEDDDRFDPVAVPGRIPPGVDVDAALFLHADGAASPSASGYSFGFPEFSVNKRLAEAVAAEFEAIAGHPKRRVDNGTTNASKYFGFGLVKTPGPEVLVEHGFVTNPGEHDWMQAHVQDLAEAEYRALCAFFAIPPQHNGNRPAMRAPTPVQLGAVTPATPLMGRTSAPPAPVVAHILGRDHGEYADGDVRNIVAEYHRVCSEVGLNAHVALAQMVLETGALSSFWAQRPRRNPAGIGVTGKPGEGISFSSWQIAIRAHVGRLLAYAMPDSKANAAQRALIVHALSFRTLPGDRRGVAPTISGLAGTWATDPEYDEKICRVAMGMRGTS